MPVLARSPQSSRLIVTAASLTTIAIGLAFIFVRAPHPWGWEGFDHYHELALRLARGEPFPTTDVPWGYAYFLAAFYRLAGDRPWVPLTAQAVLNGLTPVLLYALVRRDLGERVAVLSAALAALLSFNTVYASTQSSDAICTVCFLASLVLLARGLPTGRMALFAASGFLAGLSAQFRPNLLLFPAVAAVAAWALEHRSSRLLRALTLYLVVAVAANVPWIVRNFRLTGEFIPSSTHGGQQLWYGTLQTGPYLTSRAYNPGSVFEAASFDYSSLLGRSLIVTAEASACAKQPLAARLTYWTDRDGEKRVVDGSIERGKYSFEIPGQPAPTAVYYYFTARAQASADGVDTPAAATTAPFVFFVDDRHLADLDRHGDLIDAFDFVRIVRWLVWNEPLLFADRLDLNGDGRVTEADLDLLGRALSNAGTAFGTSGSTVVVRVDRAAAGADVHFVDGSTLFVPRDWSGRITDLIPRGNLAQQMCVAHSRRAALFDAVAANYASDRCREMQSVRVNDVFYRREPHMMRRYTALAFDNIRRDPAAFIRACAYRVSGCSSSKERLIRGRRSSSPAAAACTSWRPWRRRRIC